MGYVLIFNNENFDDEGRRRDGSHYDVQKLKNIFHNFNFRIKIVNDPTLRNIRDNMEQLLTEDLKKALCLVVVIMTHGEERDIAHACDQTYNINEEIIRSRVFAENPKLPKIVITQACKEKSEVKRIPPRNPNAVRDVDLVFRFDSTFEGSPARRLTNRGSIFIQFLCTKLEELGFEKDFRTIADTVLIEFKVEVGKYTSEPQTPTIVEIGNKVQVCFGKRARELFGVNVREKREFVV